MTTWGLPGPGPEGDAEIALALERGVQQTPGRGHAVPDGVAQPGQYSTVQYSAVQYSTVPVEVSLVMTAWSVGQLKRGTAIPSTWSTENS